ncbi:MAG: pyridoxal phosphate-dependent class II aminotransferase [Desulfobacterales bacterium]|nr:pyridoxal phosphate-dependent class II aminotransferase [Desulfobacterales bacterium]
MITGHGGNIYDLARRLEVSSDDIIDMSSNLNPLGPPPGLVDFLEKNLASITALPEVDAGELIKAFAKEHDIGWEKVLAGQGTTQFIYALPRALETKKALILGPTYADYEDSLKMNQVDFSLALADESHHFHHDIEYIMEKDEDVDTVFVCNPNNPTGTLIPAENLIGAADRYPDTWFIIDESYLPFVPNAEQESLITSGRPNVIVLSSMSKIFRIPGLRVGFLIGSENIIEQCQKFQFPWSVNSLAQVAAQYILGHQKEMNRFIEESNQYLESERQQFIERLKQDSRLTLFSGPVPYILIKLGNGLISDVICQKLADEKILIRNCANFKGLSHEFIRISLKKKVKNQMVADKLLALL